MEKSGSMNTDIVFGILSRLAEKDLVELISVSKRWKDLIANASFIKVQSQRREGEPLSGFFFQHMNPLWRDPDIRQIKYIPVKCKKEDELHDNVFHFLPQAVVLLASCNGLLCCRSCYPWYQNQLLFVCNPLNKEWIKVDWDKHEPCKEDNIALAFDPFQDFDGNSTNFKLVRVTQSASGLEKVLFSFHIYFSKIRSWKLSKEICWSNGELYKNNSAYVAGKLHWITDENEILTFNVENELAWLISPPLYWEFNGIPGACIGESQGVLHYIMISEEGLNVWFLEDYVKFNWSLKHSETLEKMEQEHGEFLFDLRERVKPDFIRWIEPLAFRNGVLFLRVSNSIYFYHIENSKMEKICESASDPNQNLYSPTVLPYTMSLIPLLTKP